MGLFFNLLFHLKNIQEFIPGFPDEVQIHSVHIMIK